MGLRGYNSEATRSEIAQEKSVAHGARKLVKPSYESVEYGKKNPTSQTMKPGIRKATKYGVYDPTTEAY